MGSGATMEREVTAIPGCWVLRSPVHADGRGRFVKPYSASVFAEFGAAHEWTECFWSVSRRGVVRGFHVQLPPAEHDKLIWVVSGVSHSAVVDLRAGSPAFGRTVVVELDAIAGRALYVPAGVAHGFQALEDNTIVVYLVTSAHDPARDAGVRWDSTAVTWPLPVSAVSERDKALPALASFATPFEYKA